ncbi:electron transfer flavoprotein subunit beta [Planctomycetota bacterium]|jgi:electron transfer flavoprotein beta subunit|nr:electron transfer flavoprotein subunit beta/FixA family protein [Planctomycetota bacterium]MSR39467.1 electron transfer flavoprotein beta subunit/FixA family protein [Planctomycetota bacterium]GDY03483.1 electron transfer flavoprotein subunit beta [Planctomycetota bacterium]
MEIVVCIKRVPATDTAIKIAADGKSIETQGVTFELNAYDEFALEQALRIKEQLNAGSVTVVTVGPKEAQKQLQDALARGADKAVLLLTNEWVHDSWACSHALAAHINKSKYDLLLCGRQAMDADNNQLPSRLAALLGFGCVTEVSKLSLANGVFTAERDIEGAREVIECKTPAVISCNKGLNEPRYANLKGIMAAKKKPYEESPAALPTSAMAIESLTLPPARKAGRILGTGAAAVPALIAALRNEVKVL